MSQTLYSPLGAKVTVSDARAVLLLERGWTADAPTIPEHPDPPWGEGGGIGPAGPAGPVGADGAAGAAGPAGPAGVVPSPISKVFLGTTGSFADYTVQETVENEDLSTAPNRFARFFQRKIGAVLQAAKLTAWENEFGEIRGISAKINTTFFRIFVKDAPGDTAHSTTIPVFEVVTDRTNRVFLAGIMADGRVLGTNIGDKVVISATDPGAGIAWLNIGP